MTNPMPKPFDEYPLGHPCQHCGCRRDEHRLGSSVARDDVHSCPSTTSPRVAQPFPRQTAGETKADYRRRVEDHWAATSFEPVPDDPARLAERALRQLSALASRESAIDLFPGASAMPVRIPAEAFAAFLEVLSAMAKGEAVVVVPSAPEMSTQEAADTLGVSRPFLVSLIEEGKIPFRLVGTHRRIKTADVAHYAIASQAPHK